MYEKFFRMKQRPFAATPSPAGYVPAQAIEQARQQLARGIERAEGPGWVVGPAGTGKSLLLAVLAAQFADRFEVVQLVSGRLRSVRALLQNILFELKLPYRDLTEGELRLALLDRLEPRDRARHGLLLLVDEAHAMPVRLLEELRMITNLVRGGEARVRLVLAGDTRLEERFANPRLASFQQRVAARCYLSSLARQETFDLVRTQLTASGVMPGDIFADEALEELHRTTAGVPRLINQLCDHALVLAAVAADPRVTAARISEAWADLQQLPILRVAEQPAAEASGDSIVEFGELDELPPRDQNKVNRFDAPVARRRREFDPLAQLEAIERQVAAAANDEFDDFEPVGMFQPEAELTFAAPLHPFGGVYDEEEVVIDRYASLEAQTLRSRPQVTSREGREIAALMGTTATTRSKLGVVSAEHALTRDEAYEDPFDPASDPVMPDYYPHVSENVAPTKVAADHPDVIVVESASDLAAAAIAPTGRAKRQEYRQLFARLRRGG
ncbi:MAG TPA: AAA family ATPase [Pirellulaceae bacterium]|nr:AAA family ATPase [Pirellulaceae bacterium]